MISIVVFSQSVGGKESLNVKELSTAGELQAAQLVATELGGNFRQTGNDLVIDDVAVDVTKITAICRAKKLTWMENRSLISGRALV